MNHFILKTTGVEINQEQIKLFLERALPARRIMNPAVTSREQGFFAVCATQQSHITVSVVGASLGLSVVSAKTIDENNIITLFSKSTNTPIQKIIVYHLGSQEAIECQESRCTRPARKDYNGLKLCQDHYEAWTEKESNISWERSMYR